MTKHSITNALVVEDRPNTLKWLRQAVVEAFPDAAVRTAETLSEAGALAVDSPFDLALIDLALPDGSGVELITALAARQPRCIPVVATVYDDDEHLFAALRAGAHGYLLKDQSQADIVRLLRGLSRGEAPLSPGIARRVLEVFRQPVAAENGHEPLTQRERDVLVFIAKGYSLARVAEPLGISRNTVAYHVQNIYQKLHINNRAEAVLEAVRLGLINPQT